MRGPASLLPAVTLIAAAPVLVGATGLTTAFAGRVLAAQNGERSGLGLPPLVWDPRLAATAQRWADHLAQTGSFAHAPERPDTPEGENLWRGTRNAYPIEAMVDGWLRERQVFKPGLFPDNSTTGRVGDVGHYTQIVWRATHAVGCAKAADANDDILVCRYSEAGNYEGEAPF